MQLLVVEIGKLKPYESNPVIHTADDVDDMVKIVEAQGFLDPIHVDPDWEIVAGHRRYLSAQKLKLSRVPVIYHEGMTKDEARMFRISSNKAGEEPTWNREMLSNELLALEHLMGSPADIGFNGDEMIKLFDLDMADKTDADLEGMKKEEPGPYIKHGQAWRIGPVTFEVYKNLSKDQLRSAEAAIIKIQKLVKHEAKLGEQTLKEYLAEAQREEQLL